MNEVRRSPFGQACPECFEPITLVTTRAVPDGRGGYRRTLYHVVCGSMNCLDRVASVAEANSGRLRDE